jgi:hypothetical protein
VSSWPSRVRQQLSLTALQVPTANRPDKWPNCVGGGTKATLTQARENCTSGGFTSEAPTLAQYRIGPLDADLRCTGPL